MPKHIAILGPLGLPIPPKKQGGIEWMVHYLTEGLVKKGWPVLLFGPKTSKTKAKLIPICQAPLSLMKINENEASRKLRLELSILAKVRYELKKKRGQIGLVLNHLVDGGILADLEKGLGWPVYHITHLPIYPELAEVYQKYESRLIAISNSQRRAFPKLNYQRTIYNGVDLKKFPFGSKAKDYFLFAGKIRASKNPKQAILASKKLRAKLILAGKISDQKYFKQEIKPLLGKNIVYLGEVPFTKLLTLYSRAKALLFPILWSEPFGLVMIEAMACGTPVIAFDRGSAREVIKDKKTGFIVKNKKGMVSAMKKIEQIKRENCRQWVKENFSAEKMIEEYEKICRKVLFS